MTKILVGAADQAVAVELRSLVAGIEGAEIVGYCESTPELSGIVGRLRPDVVVLHDQLGPETTADAVRDLTFRSPATAVLVVNSQGDAASAMAAMEAGAKGVLSVPLVFDDLLARLDSARSWAERMGGLISGATADTGRELGRHGRVTLFAGAKGGVGTTTVATHMALDLRRRVPHLRVCLVDLDLQAGDVAGILESRQRVSIADVAKVSQDLSASTIMDALVQHESGIALLLTPLQVHETDFVTPAAVRAILGLLRQEFDAILVDGGSHVTPAQAAAAEVADEVALIVTPDVLAMRSFRRTVQAWDGLGVRAEQDLHLLVNRVSREDVLNADALARLTSAQLVSTRLPAMFRRLERGVNSRNPEEVREAVWWSALEQIGAEIGVVSASAVPAAPSAGASRAKRRGGRRARAEAGQVALETVTLVPMVVLVCLLVWQVGLSALAFTWHGHAANAAARAHSLGDDPQAAARAAVPDSMRDSVQVTELDDGTVRVSLGIPVLCPGCAALPGEISEEVGVVTEP